MPTPSVTSARSRRSKISTKSVNKITIEAFKLEVFAEDLKERLQENKRVGDHYVNAGIKKIPNSFQGDHAVQALFEILQEQRTREEGDQGDITLKFAVQVGWAIAKEFQFFVHATNDKKLLEANKNEIYIFQNNLPMQVYKAKKSYPTLWDKVRLLEEHVEVKDRKTLARVHSDCLVAREAVDCCMDFKLAKSRGDAVSLLNMMNEKVHFCKHATNSNPKQAIFSDKKDLFFRFTPESQRTAETSMA